MQPRILVLTKDEQIYEAVRFCLAKGQFQIFYATELMRAQKLLRRYKFQLGVCDRDIEADNIFPFLKNLRQHDLSILILVISAKNQVEERIKVLHYADDFLAKPYALSELSLHIKNLLSKTKQITHTQIQLAKGYTYCSNGLLLADSGQQSSQILTRQEQKIFQCLLQHHNMVVTPTSLMAYVWGYAYQKPNQRTIRVYIRRLRVKLGTFASHLHTIKGVGYLLSIDESGK